MMQKNPLKRTWCFFHMFLLLAAVFAMTGCTRRVVWEQTGSVSHTAAGVQTVSDEPSEIKEEVQEQVHEEREETEIPVWMTVHVCGAVISPGVYRLPEGSRLYHAVEAAGGFAENADTVWCNQARYVEDQEQVRIYTLEETAVMEEAGEKPEGEAAGSASGISENGGSLKININTASADQLQTLPGIGASRAEAIISYRENNGAFTAIEDIMKISGIKEALFGQIKDKIMV